MLSASTLFMMKMLQHHLCAHTLREHFTGANTVTWLTCLVGWLNVIGFFVNNDSRLQLKESIKEYLADPSNPKMISAVHDKTVLMASFASYYKVFVADAHIFFMCRCFVSLQFQPRLSIVTQTLMATSVDLFHFLIVLIPTYIAFSIAGMMMFGRRMESFSSLPAALSTCFKLAVEGEFEWSEYSEQDFWTSALWVWFFLLLIVLLMMNMVLAIIMDVYQMIRAHAGSGITFWSHILYVMYALNPINRGSWMKDKELLARVNEMPETISVDELRAAFPEMLGYQLNHMVSDCQNKTQVITRLGINQMYSAQMVAAIHLALYDVRKDLSELRSRGWIGGGLEVGKGEPVPTIHDILASTALQSHWLELTSKQIRGLHSRLRPRASRLSRPSQARQSP